MPMRTEYCLAGLQDLDEARIFQLINSGKVGEIFTAVGAAP